jgi:succinate dehydrogenase/fumarate reductase flavoprotein subunit
MAGIAMNAVIRVRDVGRDAEGNVIARLSFEDMSSLTGRVTTWITHVVAAIEAAGLHVEVGPDEALALFVAGVSAEDAAAQMIAAARPAPDANPLEEWEGASLTSHLRSWPAAPPDTDAFSAAYAGGLMEKAADEIDRLTADVARLQNQLDEIAHDDVSN